MSITKKWRKDDWITETNQKCTVIIEDGRHGVIHVAIVYADEDADLIVNAPTLQSRIKELEAELGAARAEAFTYGRCCELYQDGLGQFHCHDCGQKTFAMLKGVQRILGDGTESAMDHKEAVRIALICKTAPETIDRLEAKNKHLNTRCGDLWDATKELEAEKAELVEILKRHLKHWDNKFTEMGWAASCSVELADVLSDTRAALSKHTPVPEKGGEQTNSKKEVREDGNYPR